MTLIGFLPPKYSGMISAGISFSRASYIDSLLAPATTIFSKDFLGIKGLKSLHQ